MEKTNKNFDKKFDVIVIGGGASGISAALWCDELGLSTALVEKEKELGGQLLRVFNRIENHLGIVTENGKEMRDIFLAQTANRKFTRFLESEIVEANLSSKNIKLVSGEILSAKSLIIATGVRRRKLGVKGEDFFKDKGIIESGKRDSEKVSGKNVLIVGGGDAAIENALILAEKAKKVYVAHRRSEFRAREEFLNKAKENPKIELLPEMIVKELIGDQKLEKIYLENVITEELLEIYPEKLLLRIGVEPNTELFQGQIELNSNGYIKTNANCETNIENIFAIGDVSNEVSPTISTAVGTGSTVGKVVFERLSIN